MTSETSLKMKKPWLAGLLNLILPGLGFIYVGTVGWILGGIMLSLFTLGGRFTPVVWPFTGAGIPQISAWSGLVIFTTPLCTYGARRRNKKIKEKTGGMIQTSPQQSTSQPVADSVTYCLSCGTEVKSRYVFCAKCGKKIEE